MIIYLILFINILIYTFTLTKGLNWLSPAPLDLYTLGGNLAPLSVLDEKYLLFTSIFLHGGIVHLLINSVLLIQVGSLALKKFSQFYFLIIYLFSGLCGSLMSAYWSTYHLYSENPLYFSFYGSPKLNLIVSVGASGAILGIAAASLIVNFLSSDKNADSFWIDTKQLAPVVGINVVIGFFIPGIDNWAHIGGTLSGFILGLVFYKFQKYGFKLYPIAISLSGLIIFSALKIPVPVSALEVADQLKFEFIVETEKKRKLEVRKKADEEAVIEESQLPAVSDPESISELLLKTNEGSQNFYLSHNKENVYFSLSGKNEILIYNLKNKQSKYFKFELEKPLKCLKLDCEDTVGSDSIVVSKDETWALLSYPKNNSVRLVDLSSGKVLFTFPVGNFPRRIRISNDEKMAYVFNVVDNSVSVLDIEKRQTHTNLVLGELHSYGLSYYRPVSMIIDDKSHLLYVIDDLATTLVIFDTLTYKKVSTIPIANEEFGLYDLFFTKSRDVIWILTSMGLIQFDVNSRSVIDTLSYCNRIDGAYTGALTDNDQHFILNIREAQTLVAVSLKSRKTRRVYPLKSFPNDIIKLNEHEFIVTSHIEPTTNLSLFNWNRFTSSKNWTDHYDEILCFPSVESQY